MIASHIETISVDTSSPLDLMIKAQELLQKAHSLQLKKEFSIPVSDAATILASALYMAKKRA